MNRKYAIAYAELIVKCMNKFHFANNRYWSSDDYSDAEILASKEMKRYETLRNYLIERIKRQEG